jgi:release factor glutamine methyltransferase
VLASSGLPQLEARILVSFALGVDRAWIAAHSDDQVQPAWGKRIERFFSRRRGGEPVAYITGEREFYGLAFEVSPAVLIPRPETELLVEKALEVLRPGDRVLDLGTGSGAIAVAIAQQRPDISMVACDASAAALDVASANVSRHGVKVELMESDWFSAVEGRFNVIVGNPPYIASEDPHLKEGDLRFEPRGALDAGPVGIECIEAIGKAARNHLVPGGWLLLEHGYDQGEACLDLFGHLGYAEVSDATDLAGHPRVVVVKS